MLQAAAAAGATQLVRPAGAVAAAPTIFERWVGGLAGTSAELSAPRSFVLAGVQWDGPADARIELRARTRGGRWSRWGLASTLGHGPDGAPSAPALIGSPLWTGRADIVQLRSAVPVRGVRLHFVDVRTPGSASSASASPLAQPVLDAGPGQPPIIARSAWAGGHAPPRVPPGYGEVKLAFVHHTDSLNGYGPSQVPAILLAMYGFHRFTNGWNDIGYNFVIDLFGRIWEARAGGIDQAVIGAQAGGYNQQSTGVAILGTFTDAVPSPAALAALAQLLAWKLAVHGVPSSGTVTVAVNPTDSFYTPFPPGAHVRLPRVAGHRQGCSTDCPGDALYAELPAVRARVAALAGPLQRVTLAGPGTPTPYAAPVTVSGVLTAAGRPVAGAPLEIQAVAASVRTHSETTLATVTTAADGSWSTQLSVSANTLVRALHRAPPATTSPVVELAVTPEILVSLVSSTPLTVRGTVTPTKRAVLVTLYGVRHGRLLKLRGKKVRTRRGAFTASFGARPSGSYVVVVTSSADALSAAGRAGPVAITVP